jgi:hypothetical protein
MSVLFPHRPESIAIFPFQTKKDIVLFDSGNFVRFCKEELFKRILLLLDLYCTKTIKFFILYRNLEDTELPWLKF